MTPDQSALVARLAAFESLRTIPEAELLWLVTHGDHRMYDAGAVLLTPDDQAQEMVVQLSGCIVVYFGRGAGRRHAAHSRAGSITGLLPFSRLKRPPADVLVEEPTELIAIHRDQFPAMMRECPVLVESLVHNLIDRARRFAAADWQDEKLLSLGRLAAGLAHELNNPASAASSDARRLSAAMHELGAAAYRFGVAPLDDAQRAVVTAIVEQRFGADHAPSLSPLARADLEDVVCAWLEERNAPPEWAAMLVDGGLRVDTLHELAATLPPDELLHAVHWIAASAAASSLVAGLENATRRIHDVVSSVRDFTHMDREAAREPIDVAAGLRDTVGVLRATADAKQIAIALDVSDALPKVLAVAPSLNQVWSHLIENAVDAVSAGGRIDVRATVDGGAVVVSVEDTGCGIPIDVQPHIFDPFFTTKPVGEGVGLGLDIVRRSAREFGGEVEFESAPGRTVFRVRLAGVAEGKAGV